MVKSIVLAAWILGMVLLPISATWGQVLKVQLRYQAETKQGSDRYHTLTRDEAWLPAETAVIVCDVWDLHHCQNAVRRLEEFVPRLNAVLGKARDQGATIIHAPSDCMEAYADHPARAHAVKAPRAAPLPSDIEQWCSRIPAEERAVYPIDQSDGGEDDDPDEHAAWAAKLVSLGRNPGMPWKRQSDMLTIDAARDFISDRGDEVWNILESRGIKHVILTGVHTNMCVIGRPFGLRQMVRSGRQVVLMRDMTDTMYNPARWPYVSHFTGTDLVISHIEKFVCPTITSDQILGGRPFRFAGDKRPHLAIVVAEEGYETGRTLPAFAAKQLGRAFRVSYVFASQVDPHDMPGLDVLDQADLALFSVRRRVLKPEQMAVVRRFVQAGKPVLGIRTASHAFSLRDASPPAGYVAWPEFDAQVFGGNYHGHPNTPSKATIRVTPEAARSPLFTGIPAEPWLREGALYLTSPLASGANVLLTGARENQPTEPVAWTYQRAGGGKSFYTSLGEPADFEHPVFVRLLANALHGMAGLPIPNAVEIGSPRADFERHWQLMSVPGSLAAGSHGILQDYTGPAWYRCVVRVPTSSQQKSLSLSLPRSERTCEAWFNGHLLESPQVDASGTRYTVKSDWVTPGDANLVVVRIAAGSGDAGFPMAPAITCDSNTITLQGRWQVHLGDDRSWSNMPLPAKFGTSTDIVFDPHLVPGGGR